MSLQSLKDMLSGKDGEYILDFTNPDDCEYLYEIYGGEEAMREKYPALYENFFQTKQASHAAKASRGIMAFENNEEPGTTVDQDLCPGNIYGLNIKSLDRVASNRADAIGAHGIQRKGADRRDEFVRLSVPVGFAFIDGTKDVASDEAAEEWIGVTIRIRAKQINATSYSIDKGFCLPKARSYHDYIESAPSELSQVEGRRYTIVVDVVGTDPSGKKNAKVFKRTYDSGNIEEYTLDSLELYDPMPKSEQHRMSNLITMLYGRDNQADADYKNGDYYNNTFNSTTGTVHLVMPYKGKLIYNVGVRPDGLYKPTETETLNRPRVVYDNKSSGYKYYGKYEDSDVFDKMEKFFIASEYRQEVQSVVDFDFKNADNTLSVLDWHIDLDGLANYSSKNLFLDNGFTYSSYNQLGDIVYDQVTIKSVTEETLKKIKHEYYKLYPEDSNMFYIPPIRIFWGCFGRDVKILMADKSLKNACDIMVGDKVTGYDDKILTVDNVLTGQEAELYRITTTHGETNVSGGHVMLADGEKIRACNISAGSKLNMPSGTLAEVTRAERVEYNDTVYNFTFVGEDSGVFLVSDGFYTGDLHIQNTPKETKERVFTPFEKQIMAESMLWSMAQDS